MDRRKKFSVWGVWGFLLLSFIFLAPGNSGAVTINPTASSFDFSFNSPGARANGMGGAFIGVADDATAAYTNPAGLTVLTKPEVALEYKYTNRTTFQRVFSDRPPYKHEFEYDDNDTNGLSFLSFSYPVERGNITIFRHELVNMDVHMPQLLYDFPVPNSLNTVGKFHNQTDVTTYGIAGAYKLFNTLSVGGTVGFNELDYRYKEYRYGAAPSPFNDTASTWGGDDWATNFTVGLLWNPFGGLNVGAVYRYGPEFKYVNHSVRNNVIDGTTNFTYQFEDVYKIPDVYGIGVSYRFPFGLTLAVDYNYIKYSQISEHIYTYNGNEADGLKLDDAYEVHAGLEWAFTVKDIPLAIRTGYAFKEAHGLDYSGNSADQQYINQRGDDENIFSAGFGIVLFKNLQLDFSGAWGNLSTEYIGSVVFRY